jgi:hypothetical protein
VKNFNVSERQYTIICAFDQSSPRISAYEIHELIYAQICLEDQERLMVQIDGLKHHVYINFRDSERMREVLQSTGGEAEYKRTNGVISCVRISMAGMGLRRVRIANLPPEMPDGALRTILAIHGEAKDIQAETWPRLYWYPVANGIRLAMITIARHIPSHITVAGNRVPLSYEGQPMTCYGCNHTGRLYEACPLRRSVQLTKPTTTFHLEQT